MSAILLLAGMATCFATAWFCAWRLDLLYSASFAAGISGSADGGSWGALRFSRAGRESITLRTWDIGPQHLHDTLYWSSTNTARDIAPWCEKIATKWTDPHDPDRQQIEIQRFGWPFPSMWCRYTFRRSLGALAELDRTTGIPIADRLTGRQTVVQGPGSTVTILAGATVAAFPRALPLRFVWPSFVLQSLLFGILWIGLWQLTSAAFRRFRHVPGRCRSCGYDLRANTSGTCPECGRYIAISTIKSPSC